MTLLITYDLNKETKRPPIVQAIKDLGNWARLSESSYAVSTNLSPTQVHTAVKPHLDDNDNIYIITLTRPYTGFGPKDLNDWLEKNL